MIKVSIIIPIYNSAKYLKQCLDSILSQTLEDFEIICINDGSKDNSLEILREYASKDNRFIIIDKKNEGQGVARNIAIPQAKGEYLIFVDSDDWLENNALELAYNKIKKDKTDILFFDCFRHFENLGKKELHRYTNGFKNFKEKPFSNTDDPKILLKINALPYKMYKTKFIQTNDIKFSNHKFMEDMPFFIKSILLSTSMSCLATPIYNYRIHQQSSTFNHKEILKSIKEVYDICFSIINKYNKNQEIFSSFITSRKNGLIYFYELIPFYKKNQYYNIMREIILNNFPKDKLDDDLLEILEKNHIIWSLNCKMKKTKYILDSFI